MNKMFDARFNGNRQPVWKALGTTFEVNINASDALVEIGGDFELFKSERRNIIVKDGKKILVYHPGYSIMREKGDGWISFGDCGDQYEIIQRKTFARLIDDLTLRWPLETMGMLDDGKTLFCMLNAGMIDINGDPMTMYFMITDTADGGTSAKAVFTGLRMNCWNMLITTLKRAVVSMSMLHRQGIERQMAFTVELAGKMATSQTSTVEYFNYMAKKILTPEQATRIFNATYPMPKRPAKMDILDIVDENDTALADIRAQGASAAYAFEYYVNRAQEMRDNAHMLLERFNDEFPRLANSAYAMYNVPVELADWREGPESANADAIFGQRAAEKKRAFTAVEREIK